MFSDEEVSRCEALMSQPVQPTGTDDLRRATVRRMMEATAELLAARGGTMDASTFHRWQLFSTELRGGAADLASAILAHATAQGARIAALEAKAKADEAAARANIEGWRDTAKSREAAMKRLEHHISDLERSLENVRQERDEATDKARRLREELSGHIRAGVETAEILAGPGGPLGEGIVAGAKRVASERDEALADNAALRAWVDERGHATWCVREHDETLRCTEGCAAAVILAAAHPGAALLERMKRLEEQSIRVRQEGREAGLESIAVWAENRPRGCKDRNCKACTEAVVIAHMARAIKDGRTPDEVANH